MVEILIIVVSVAAIGCLYSMFLAVEVKKAYNILTEIEYRQVKNYNRLIVFNPELQPPVKPIRTCMSKNPLGVNGVLITGECPICGQKMLNNADNKYCGGCARRLEWKTDCNLK